MPRDTLIQYRHGTSVAWAAANPVLELGEPGWDTDLKVGKVGDGVTEWSSLPAAGGGEGVAAAVVPTAVKTGAYQALVGDLVLVDATASVVAISAPLAPAVGDVFAVMKIDTSGNSVTVTDPDSTINGDSEAEIVASYAGATFIWSAAGWLILSVMAGTTTGSSGGLTIFDGGSAASTFSLTTLDGGTAASTYVLSIYSGGNA